MKKTLQVLVSCLFATIVIPNLTPYITLCVSPVAGLDDTIAHIVATTPELEDMEESMETSSNSNHRPKYACLHTYQL